MNIKKISTKIIALILTLAVVSGMALTLNAVSSADSGDFAPIEAEQTEGEKDDGFTPLEPGKNQTDDDVEVAPEEPKEPAGDSPTEKKAEGKSGPSTFGTRETLPPSELQVQSGDIVGADQDHVIVIPTVLTAGTYTGSLDFSASDILAGPNGKEKTTYVINKPGTYTITGSTTSHVVDAIRVKKGIGSVKIILDNANIQTKNEGSAPITIEGVVGDVPTDILNVTIELKSGTTNTLIAENRVFSTTVGAKRLRAALEVRRQAKLTIQGDGTLVAKSAPNEQPVAGFTIIDPHGGNGGGAGIGGGWGPLRQAGSIYIKSGNIIAEGGVHGSGIGSGWENGDRHVSNILIIGGTISSTGGLHGNGIGGSCKSANKGAIVVVPPSNVTSKSKASDITEAIINDASNSTIKDHLTASRESYGDIGSSSATDISGARYPNIFYMGKETVHQVGEKYETNTVVYRPADENAVLYNVYPVRIASTTPATQDTSFSLDILTKMTSTQKGNLAGAFDLYDGTLAERESFFKNLYFGTIKEGEKEINRIALICSTAVITAQIGVDMQAQDITLSTPTIKDNLSGLDDEAKEMVGDIANFPGYIGGVWTTKGAFLTFKSRKFNIDNKGGTKPLMYGFTDGAEAEASTNKYHIYNNLEKDGTTGFIVTQDIENLKLKESANSFKNTFTYTGMEDILADLITSNLKTVENAKDDVNERKELNFYPKSKDASGNFLKFGSHIVEGEVIGTGTKTEGFSYTQVITKGDYLETGVPKAASDNQSNVVAKTRLENHFKVTDTITAITTPVTVTKGVNKTNNSVTLKYDIIDNNLKTSGTTAKYVILKEGSEIPATNHSSWVNIPANGEVKFAALTEGKMVIYYMIDNPYITIRGLGGTYDVDLVDPEVKLLTQELKSGVTKGYISFNPETINFEFTENIWDFKPDSIEITRDNKKTNNGHFKVISTGTQNNKNKPSLKIQIDPSKIAEIENLEWITISVKDKVVTDRLANTNKSSQNSAAAPSGDTILKLRFVKEKPKTFITYKDQPVDGKVYKHNPKTMDVTVEAKNVTASLNGAMYKNTGQSTLLTAAEILGDQAYYKNYIKVTDKKTNSLVNYASISYLPNNTTGGKFTIDFGPNGLADGDYKITVVGDYIFNELSIPAELNEAEFSVRAPAILQNGATIDKTYFEAEGGKATITIKGKYMTEASEFTIYEETNQIADIVIKPPTNDNELTAVVTFPKNTSYDDQLNFKFKVKGKITGEPDIAPVDVVAKANPTAGQAVVVVNRVKSVVKFDLNGGTSDIKDIIADKNIGNKNGVFDFKEYDYGNPKVPGKKDHLFVGWYLQDGSRGKEFLDLKIKGGGVYTLKAMWIDLRDVVDEDDDGGDKTDPDIHGDAKIFVVNPARNTARYVGENTFAEILGVIGGYVEITPLPGYEKIKIPLNFIWSNTDVNQAGVKSGKVAINNPQTGEPILQHFTTYIYITNYPYISNRSFVSFMQYDRPTENGSEWSPKVVEEIPDFKSHRIVIKNHPVIYDPNGFTTDLIGLYTVKFNANITTYRGVKNFKVPQSTGQALVSPRDEGAQAEREYLAAEQKYWMNASKSLHLLYKGMGWQIDKTNYIFDGDEIKNFKAGTGYDRMILAEANGFPMMSAEILQVLKEQDNSFVEVRYGDIIWKFLSTDFKDEKILPTGYFDLGYATGNTNEKINKLLGTRTQQQIAFKMNKPFMGQGEITIKLDKALRENASLNLFHFNEGSNELELVGKMINNKDGTARIKLSEVRNNYVILTGLSKDSSSEQVLSYRITDITKDFDKATTEEVERDLKSVGKDIKAITAKTADDDTLKQIRSQNYSDGENTEKTRKIIMISVVSGGAILVIVTGIYLYLKNKKKETFEK